MARKPTVSRAEFSAIVSILEAIPFHGDGKTAREILVAARDPYTLETMAEFLAASAGRGWLVARGHGARRRYTRVIWDPKNTLAELVTIV